MTLSPTATSSGTRLPLSSMRPGPIAWTSPSWGFSLAVSGMTRPEAVVCSASSGLTTMRSSRGLMLTDTVSTSTFVLSLGWHTRPESANDETSTLVDGVPERESQRVLARATGLDEPDPLRAHAALDRACPGTPSELLAVALTQAELRARA